LLKKCPLYAVKKTNLSPSNKKQRRKRGRKGRDRKGERYDWEYIFMCLDYRVKLKVEKRLFI
jgi:hypothetical protein